MVIRPQICHMIIESIIIENFRGISRIEIPAADRHFNLLVGINGAGKSSVLDALAYVFSWFLARVRNPKSGGRVIPEADIKNDSQTGCKITVKVKDAGEWVLYRAKSYKKKKTDAGETQLHDMMGYIAQLHERVAGGGNIPVIMYYPVGRAIGNAPAHLTKNGRKTEIWDAYGNVLNGNVDFRSFFEWYRRQEDSENEHIRDDRNYVDRDLAIIRSAIKGVFPEFGDLRVRRNPQRFVINKGDKQIEFNQLSQGEKCYLVMVCDLARRFAIANPGRSNPLEGEGVVLIDELDLHLHPKWQMEVVGKLRQIFPNCQFFATTHSPHVLSDVSNEQIYLLDNGEIRQNSYNPYGKLVNDVLSSYFSIPMPRNISIISEISNAYEALKIGDSCEFKKIFGRLSERLGKSDPDVVSLKIESLRKGIK